MDEDAREDAGTAGETSFGALLRRLRLARGLTQEELAERAHLSVRGLSDLERGARQRARPETFALLIDALRLDASERAHLDRLLHQSPARRPPDFTTPTTPAEHEGPSRPSLLARPTDTPSLHGFPPVSVSAGPLPTGTVTFLFTDVEGSTRLWEQHPAAMRAASARHDALIEEHVDRHGGVVVRPRGEGDSRFAVFARASDAVAAAAALQAAVAAESWPVPIALRVRMALHTGEADLRDGDYYGSAVNRCARLRAIAHGGQVLLSQTTHDLVRHALPAGVDLRDLGEHRLMDLTLPEHIFQVTHFALPADFPPLKSLDAYPNNLPLQLTSFLGREREIAAVKDLLATTRLLTLTGAGGSGKTRLALQVAADLAAQFTEGIFLVSLGELRDPALVAPAIAQTLGVVEIEGQSLLQSLTSHLRGKDALLVLDNFEQVAPASVLVADLLAACSRLKVLVTSRFVLRLSGEQEFQVPPLRVPDPERLPPPEQLAEYEAIRLFVSRAQAVKADFALDANNAAVVARICKRLDGLPLAIELAAARIRVLPPPMMLTRLASASGGLQLLAGGPGDVPTRQQALRNAIAWSYDLLDAPEQTLIRRLSAFVGGWTLEAAEAVCADGEDVVGRLEALVAKNLVHLEQQPDGTPRFSMLETIREYVLERCRERDAGEVPLQKHAAYYLDLIQQHDTLLRSPQRGDWLDRLQVEQGNIRAAVERSNVHGSADDAVRMATALLWFWRFHGFSTGSRAGLDEAAAFAPSTGGTAEPRASSRAHFGRPLPWGPALVLLATLCLPGGLLWWLLANPRYNLLLAVPREHFAIVTTVAVLALAVSLLVAWATLQVRHYRAMFLSLGFMTMAGFFMVHALATPGVLADENAPGYAGTGGSVIEVSAFLSILVPSILFAVGYTSIGARFKLGRRLPFWPGALVATLLVVLALYASVALSRAEWFAAILLSKPPSSYGLAVGSGLLLVFAAWRQARLYLATHLPLSGAFVVAFLLLGIAQMSMVLGPVWTLAWWEYHLLMYGAVLIALGTLLLEHGRGRPLRRILEGALELQRADGLNVERIDAVAALVTATELKDPCGRGHALRVAKIGTAIGREMGVSRDDLPSLARAALLHDIGHLAIPDAILLKNGPLTAEEWETMKQHADHGLDILAGIGGFQREIEMIAAHHERMDGQGYLRRLSGEAIPFGARILAVADTYDSLLMDRPYRKARAPEEARRIVREEAGTHLDSSVVEALFRVLRRRGLPEDVADLGGLERQRAST